MTKPHEKGPYRTPPEVAATPPEVVTEHTCSRCEQPWTAHPKTTDRKPAAFPTDCPCHGVVAPDAYLEGTALIFVHECRLQDGQLKLRKTQLPQRPGKWRVSQSIDGQLTVTPSIQCHACGFHRSFVAGAWR